MRIIAIDHLAESASNITQYCISYADLWLIGYSAIPLTVGPTVILDILFAQSVFDINVLSLLIRA